MNLSIGMVAVTVQLLFVALALAETCCAFQDSVPCSRRSTLPPTTFIITLPAAGDGKSTRAPTQSADTNMGKESKLFSRLRRDILLSSAAVGLASVGSPSLPAFAVPDNLKLVEQARRQLDAVPKLIDDQKWDSVRAILITPPLSDCWSKSAAMLRTYAESVDDELAALEAREDAVSHLRFLDMAVYNNVFNPIATEGTAGATKELVRSYYEDPINEWKASVKALDELIQLGKE